jgi:hypothetical protein
LIGIAGAITCVRAIGWLARPRFADDRLRVFLTLTVWPALEIEDVGVRLPSFPRRSADVARRLLVGLAGCSTGIGMTAFGQALDVTDRALVLDMLFKTVEIYLIATGANRLAVVVFGLAGYRLRHAFRYPVLPRSILDFWSRYDVCIHHWLKRNVFQPVLRSGRGPASAVLATFAFSGVAHELLFVPAAPDLLGWQLAFFMLHGAGAVTGERLDRVYRGGTGHRLPRRLRMAASVTFVLATMPVFLHCVDRLVDLHRHVGQLVLDLVGWR